MTPWINDSASVARINPARARNSLTLPNPLARPLRRKAKELMGSELRLLELKRPWLPLKRTRVVGQGKSGPRGLGRDPSPGHYNEASMVACDWHLRRDL
jgi:hypothetical protein